MPIIFLERNGLLSKPFENLYSPIVLHFMIKCHSYNFWLRNILFKVLIFSWNVKIKIQIEWMKQNFAPNMNFNSFVHLTKWMKALQTSVFPRFEKEKISGTIIFINISSGPSLQLWIIIAFGKWFPCLRN